MNATNECKEMTSDNECIVRYTQSYNTRLEILKIKEILLYHKQFTFSLGYSVSLNILIIMKDFTIFVIPLVNDLQSIITNLA